MNTMFSVYVGLGLGVAGLIAFVIACGYIGERLEQRQQRRTSPDVPVRPQPARVDTARPASAIAPVASTAPTELIPALKPALHLLCIGYTGGGKTSLLHELATQWAQTYTVTVCDPDAAPGLWAGCAVAGQGNSFAAIGATVQQVAAIVQHRREQRGRGVRRFTDHYLVIDEYQDVAREVPGARELVEDVLRRGRKLGIHLVLGVQDKQVKTLGFEGQGELRKNFSWVVEMRLRHGTERQASIQANGEGPYTVLPVPVLPDLERLIVEMPAIEPEQDSAIEHAIAAHSGPDEDSTAWEEEVRRLTREGKSTRAVLKELGGDYNRIVVLAREERVAISA